MNDSEKSSLTDKNGWNNMCTEIVNNDNIFENFKVFYGNPMPICGVSKEDGLYYDKIFNNLPLSVISKMNNSKSELLKNDEKGSPEKINTNNFGEVCPQTMRYIYTLGELTELFGDLENLNILEIGGGYGGQAKVILSLFNISSYTVIDLKEACSLQKKYLSEYNNVHFVDGKDIDYESINRKFDLVISNYSYLKKTYLNTTIESEVEKKTTWTSKRMETKKIQDGKVQLVKRKFTPRLPPPKNQFKNNNIKKNISNPYCISEQDFPDLS